MKKTMTILVLIFAAIYVLALKQAACLAEDKAVTVTGSAEIIGNNKDSAKQKALADAFRKAVESGLGVWVKSESEVKDSAFVRDEILSRAEGYVTDHEVVKESDKEGVYNVTITAKVAVDKIGADFKKLVGRVKTAMGNPSITFVLTTWKKIGGKVTESESSETDVKAGENLSVSLKSDSSKSGNKGKKDAVDIKSSAAQSLTSKKSRSYEILDEKLWKKYPDLTIIDAFQQEFKEKNFDLKATDRAREIALTQSLAQTVIDIFDRGKVRAQAEKEGANYVARGEVKVIDSKISDVDGNYEVRTQIGVEIIDVNSGDVVSAYSNTSQSSSKSQDDAEIQGIKKIAVLAAKTLADQTISTWQDRSLSGKQYVIELRNITSVRKQKMPFIKAVEAVAQITSQTQPAQDSLLLNVLFKGAKNQLENGVLNALEGKSGFSEKEFDGPFNEEGKLVFKFLQ